MPQTPFVERRKNPPQTAEHIADCQNAIRQHFDERFDMMEAHNETRWNEMKALVQSAFPNGDIEAHRRVHEGYIKNANDRADLWKAVREKTISGGVYAGAALLVMALIEAFKNWVKS